MHRKIAQRSAEWRRSGRAGAMPKRDSNGQHGTRARAPQARTQMYGTRRSRAPGPDANVKAAASRAGRNSAAPVGFFSGSEKALAFAGWQHPPRSKKSIVRAAAQVPRPSTPAEHLCLRGCPAPPAAPAAPLAAQMQERDARSRALSGSFWRLGEKRTVSFRKSPTKGEAESTEAEERAPPRPRRRMMRRVAAASGGGAGMPRDSRREGGAPRKKKARSRCLPASRERSTCKECGGAGLCQHQRIRSRCKECREEADESIPDGLEEL